MKKNDMRLGSMMAALSVVPAASQAADNSPKATPDRPNIIFILADDMGYGDLSCFGSKHVKTPNIDRLAATGTTFTQCYAGSGISSPSKVSYAHCCISLSASARLIPDKSFIGMSLVSLSTIYCFTCPFSSGFVKRILIHP